MISTRPSEPQQFAARKIRRLAASLFVAAACFYFLCSGGQIGTPDGVVMFRVARSLAQGKLDIEPLKATPQFGGEYADGPSGRRFYSQFGLGLSLAALPAYGIGTLLAPFASDRERDLFDVADAPRIDVSDHPAGKQVRLRIIYYDSDRTHFVDAFKAFMVSSTNAVVVAGIVALMFLLCLDLGFTLAVSLSTAVFAGLGTPLWQGSKDFFSEPLSAFGILAFVYLVRRGGRSERSGRWWALAGAALALSVIAKIGHLVVLPAAATFLLLHGRDLPRPRALRAFGGFCAAAVPVLALVPLYNTARFGSPFVTGYPGHVLFWNLPILEGLAGVLLSAGRGLFVYCPACLLGIAGSVRLARRFPREVLFAALCLAGLLALYAKWYMWEGGWCWGPRFLVPVIPLMILPVASYLDRPPGSVVGRLVVLGALGTSVALAFSGVTVNYIDFENWIRIDYLLNEQRYLASGIHDYYQLLRWDWMHAPAIRYWDFPVWDYFLLPRALVRPGLVLALMGLATFGLVGATASFWVTARSRGRPA